MTTHECCRGPRCGNCPESDGVAGAKASPSAQPETGWWCPNHRAYVPSQHVTFDETHDPRFGGCGGKVVANMPKPTHDQMMAGYAVACHFGVLEVRAFNLAEQMWQAMSSAGVPPTPPNAPPNGDTARIDWLNEEHERLEQTFGAMVRNECGGDLRVIVDERMAARGVDSSHGGAR